MLFPIFSRTRSFKSRLLAGVAVAALLLPRIVLGGWNDDSFPRDAFSDNATLPSPTPTATIIKTEVVEGVHGWADSQPIIVQHIVDAPSHTDSVSATARSAEAPKPEASYQPTVPASASVSPPVATTPTVPDESPKKLQQPTFPSVGPQVSGNSRYPAAINIPGSEHFPNPLGASVQIPGAGGIVTSSNSGVLLQPPAPPPEIASGAAADQPSSTPSPAKEEDKKVTYNQNMMMKSLLWGNLHGVPFYIVGEKGNRQVVDDKSRPLVTGEGKFEVSVDGYNPDLMAANQYDPNKIIPRLHDTYSLSTDKAGKALGIVPKQADAAATPMPAPQAVDPAAPAKVAEAQQADAQQGKGKNKVDARGQDLKKVALFWGKMGKQHFYVIGEKGNRQVVDEHSRPLVWSAGAFVVTLEGYNHELMAKNGYDAAKNIPSFDALYLLTTDSSGKALGISRNADQASQQAAPAPPNDQQPVTPSKAEPTATGQGVVVPPVIPAAYEPSRLHFQHATNDVAGFYLGNFRLAGGGHGGGFTLPSREGFHADGMERHGSATAPMTSLQGHDSWVGSLHNNIMAQPDVNAITSNGTHVVGSNGTVTAIDSAGQAVTFIPTQTGFDFVSGERHGSITSDGTLNCPWGGHVAKTVKIAADAVGIVYGAPFAIIYINNGAATIPAPWPVEKEINIIERCEDKCPTAKMPTKNQIIKKKPRKPRKRKAKTYCPVKKGPTCQDKLNARDKQIRDLQKQLKQKGDNNIKPQSLLDGAKRTNAQNDAPLGIGHDFNQAVVTLLARVPKTNRAALAAFKAAKTLLTSGVVGGSMAGQVIAFMEKAAGNIAYEGARKDADRTLVKLLQANNSNGATLTAA